MRKIVLLLGFLMSMFLPQVLKAQDSLTLPVQWSFSIEPADGGKYLIKATGAIEKDWGVFALSMADDMPNSRFRFDSSFTGKLIELKESPTVIKEKNALLDALISFHKTNVEFSALIEVSDPGKPIRGSINYMAFKGDEFTNPTDISFWFEPTANGFRSRSTQLTELSDGSGKIRRTAIELNKPAND